MTATSDFDYALPEHLIAQEPAADRDASRALFAVRGDPDTEVGRFSELPSRLRGDECLVVNDTRVIPARIRARRATGGAIEVFLLRPVGSGWWQAWLTPSRRLREGETLWAGEHPLLIGERHGSFWLIEAGDLGTVERHGEVPLPPYIRRKSDDHRLESLDANRYQTIFARAPGAVAAPTAGLHFTPSVLRQLAARSIPVVPLTLHVGPGTFRPISAERIEDHVVDPELFSVSESARRDLGRARREGRRFVAVGTTSLRALESLPELEGPTLAGETNLTILPGHDFRFAEGLITNFHLPRSSLLVLVSAFHGTEVTAAAYRRAVELELRFYSYGDAMVILPGASPC